MKLCFSRYKIIINNRFILIKQLLGLDIHQKTKNSISSIFPYIFHTFSIQNKPYFEEHRGGHILPSMVIKQLYIFISDPMATFYELDLLIP